MTVPQRVGFAAEPTVCRPPSEGESAVIHNFALHASHCDRCCDPWKTHLTGKTLCERGHHHARRVAKYLYSKGGRPCSTLDLQGHQPVQVEIPHGYDAVRGLLKAMERGLRLHSASVQRPIISHDRTYPIPSREVHRPHVEIVEPPTYHPSSKPMAYAPRVRHQSYYDDDNYVVYAAPRQYQPRRSSYYANGPFYP